MLRQTLQTFADFEQAEDIDTLVSLRRELLTDGLGVIGTERTVEALDKGKIDQLIVTTEYEPYPAGAVKVATFLEQVPPPMNDANIAVRANLEK